eukprot:2442764-Pyramimonas_sp.AAC.2
MTGARAAAASSAKTACHHGHQQGPFGTSPATSTSPVDAVHERCMFSAISGIANHLTMGH